MGAVTTQTLKQKLLFGELTWIFLSWNAIEKQANKQKQVEKVSF